jgi:hypothetical protein
MDYSKLVIHTERTTRIYTEDNPRAVRKNGVKDLREPALIIDGHGWRRLENIPGGRARRYGCSCGEGEGISVNEPGPHEHVARDVHQAHLADVAAAMGAGHDDAGGLTR